jgi:DNA-binding Xre family transcriptional regulator
LKCPKPTVEKTQIAQMNTKNNDAKVEDKYKYLLYKFMNELPHNQYKITSKQLPKKIGISAETFRKWKYIKKGAAATIPADKLAIIANFFDIRMEEIFNYAVPKITYRELEIAQHQENENS